MDKYEYKYRLYLTGDKCLVFGSNMDLDEIMDTIDRDCKFIEFYDINNIKYNVNIDHIICIEVM